MKIAVIGGGASGLMAAIAAKRENNSVVIYEKESRVGRKILATGNGRCNMTNVNAAPEHYHGSDPEFVKDSVNRFWVNETLEFFEKNGILWKEEDNGKIYPYSDSASSVLDVLRRATVRLNVEIKCSFDVKSVKKIRNGFEIKFYNSRVAVCDKIIIATGGRAAPSLGSNGSGYELLKGVGHKITELSPSLVQIKTDSDVVKKLKGVKVNANVKIGENRDKGEVLFTDYGLSGPPVFYLSSMLEGADEAVLDIMPEYSYNEVFELLRQRCKNLSDVPLEVFFVGMLNKRIGQAILKSAGAAPLSRLASSLSEKELKTIASIIKKWCFKIKGTMSWNNAQVTKGGALTYQFDSITMESKLIKGLYACGEVLDIDGDCGGYNLQWAWSSGFLAGTAAALDL